MFSNIKFGKLSAIIASNIFSVFCFFFLLIWYSSYMHVTSFTTIPLFGGWDFVVFFSFLCFTLCNSVLADSDGLGSLILSSAVSSH